VANSPQARKRAKQNTVRRLRNHSQRSEVRTAIKKLDAAIDAGDKEAANAAYLASVSIIDKATVKGQTCERTCCLIFKLVNCFTKKGSLGILFYCLAFYSPNRVQKIEA